jgi:hypothetical protein
MPPGKSDFGGAGNQTWETSLSTYQVGNGVGLAFYYEMNEENRPLNGFALSLYPNQGTPPPVGEWAFGQFHAISNDSWTESWESGQSKPNMEYKGGYKAAK